jgi:hypothetical protein
MKNKLDHPIPYLANDLPIPYWPTKPRSKVRSKKRSRKRN